jgi:hypothetical protein
MTTIDHLHGASPVSIVFLLPCPGGAMMMVVIVIIVGGGVVVIVLAIHPLPPSWSWHWMVVALLDKVAPCRW